MKVCKFLHNLKDFLAKVHIQPVYFVLPTVLALTAAFFEGISFGLLIPTMKGIIDMDFAFVRNLPIFNNFISMFPNIFSIGNTPIFILLVALIFLAAVMKNIFEYVSGLGVAYLSKSFSNNLRKLIYNRYLSFGKLYFDQQNIAYLYNVLIGFTTQISREIESLQLSLSSILMLLVYIVLMFTISWQLTLISFLIFPILHFALDWIIKKLNTTSLLYVEASMSLSQKISNALSCIPLVQAYTREKKEKEWFGFASDRLGEYEVSLNKKFSIIKPVQEIITLSMTLVLISVTAFLAVKEKAGEMAGYLVFFVLLRRSAAGFGIFNSVRAIINRAAGPISSIRSVFDDTGKHFIPDGNKEFIKFKHAIEFDHLSFSYPNRKNVLRDVNFSVQKGEMTSIVGPSGSGKTTLINLLIRYYDGPSAAIKIDSIDIREITLKSLRAKIALVSQETLLFNSSLKMNLTYGLDREISDEELFRVIEKARLYNLITRLPNGLNTEIGERGVKLSGGEKQRVSIARAMLKGAEILILDEATSSLDTKTEKYIQEAIDEVIKGRTSIVIAHRLSTIKNANKIVVLENGSVVEQGDLQTLLNIKGKFFSYWQEQKFD